MAFENERFKWSDKKRILGIPMTFTTYALSDDRLFLETGLFNLRDEEILLYRVRDISMRRSWFQRLFSVGTVTISSTDKTLPVLVMKNIKYPENVKEMIHECVEKVKIERRVRIGELSAIHVDDESGFDDDYFEV